MGGVEVPGYPITGFQITNPTIRAEITAALEGVDPSTLTILHRSHNNVVGTASVLSWSSSSGTMLIDSTESLVYSSYLYFSLTGDAAFMDRPGQYVIDQQNRRVTYSPVSGSNGMQAIFPILPTVWEDGLAVNRFESMEFLSGNMESSAPGMYKRDQTFDGTPVFVDCNFHSGGLGIRGKADIYNCRFDRMIGRGAAILAGCIVEKSRFSGMLLNSALIIQCGVPDVSSDPVRQSIVRDCYFELLAANHGQGISLYQNAWQNAIIEHNIFRNCQRAFSFQPGGVLRTTPGTLRFENNLIVVDSEPDIPQGGQQGISFNGNFDDHLTSEQQVIFRSNTLIANPALGNAGGSPVGGARWSLDISHLRRSSRHIENNLVGSLNAAFEGGDVMPQKNASNFMLNPIYGAAYSELDHSSAFASSFDYDSMQPIGQAASGASDGGSVGIRWGGAMSIADLRTLPDDWYDLWPALQVPIADVTAPAWFNQDLR
jgi:hypothetical protein